MSDDEPLSNSQFREWLGTNYCPSNNQVAQIKDFLEKPLNELLALNTEVLQAQQVLDALCIRQGKLEAQIKAHQALTHPIRRIPKELLQEIFLHCLPTAHLPVMASAEAPMLLTRICRQWRALALSTPTLWSSIHIPIPRGRSETEHIEATNARLACVKWWLALAKETRLTISLFWPGTLRYAYGTERKFPLTILSHSLHIRMLELDLPDSIFTIFAETPPSDLPHLEKVVVRLPVAPGHPPRGVGITGAEFWLAPRLTKVVWEGVDDEFLKLPLKWQKMQEIEVGGGAMIPMSYFSPTDALALVEACPDLVRLTLELTLYAESRIPPGFGPSNEVPEAQQDDEQLPSLPVAPLVLAHLTMLDLTDIYLDPDTTPMFLENLRLPSLKKLKYCLIGLATNTPATSTHPLLAFLRAQDDPILITHLRIGATSVSRDTFFEVLRLVPLVEQVYVEDSRPLWSRQQPDGDWREDHEMEVAPDDELLRCFLPAFVWKRERWDDEQTRYPKIKFVSASWREQPRARLLSGGSLPVNAAEGTADDGDSGEEEEEEPDVVMTEPEEENGGETNAPPDAPSPSPSDPAVSAPPRISVSIPVDTSELAAEESECLCPRLDTLRFDRARITPKALKTFVKARLKLSTIDGHIPDNDNEGSQGSQASSPTKSTFVSAPSSPLLPIHNPRHSRHQQQHHKEQLHPSTSFAATAPIAPLQRIHVGLMSHRPTNDGDGNSDLESVLSNMGVRATIRFVEAQMGRNSLFGKVRNDAREGVLGVGALEDGSGWGW